MENSEEVKGVEQNKEAPGVDDLERGEMEEMWKRYEYKVEEVDMMEKGECTM